MRVRKIVTRSGKNIRGKFPSAKLGKGVHWESMLERDAILMLEYHPLVVRYQEQPCEEIYYDEADNPRRCYPDFLCEMATGANLLLEIKYAEEIKYNKDTAKKLGLIALTFERQGRPYRVLTDEEIRRQPLHGNLLRLHDARRANLSRCEAPSLLGSIDGNVIHTLGALTALFGSEGAVLGLLAIGSLRADLETPLGFNSQIWVPSAMEAGDGSFSI